MIKQLIFALIISNTVLSVSLEGPYNIQWAYDRLDGAFDVPLLWNKEYKTTSASPVLWKSYTISPRIETNRYVGGLDCSSDNSCTGTDKHEAVTWDYKGSDHFTGEPEIIKTMFSFGKTQPTDSFFAYLAMASQSVPEWPKHFGYNKKYWTYNLNTIWGISPVSSYFTYLRNMYSTHLKDTDITFRFNIALGTDEKTIEKAMVQQPGSVLTGSKFQINIGDGPIIDGKDKLLYVRGDDSTDGFWTAANGRVTINSQSKKIELDSQTFGFGRTCFSNYWHNSVVAFNEAAEFKRQWGRAFCPNGVY